MTAPSSTGHANRYRIVVDTCADLTPEIAATLDVDILGFPYMLDGVEHTDDIWTSITPQEFYDQIRSGVKASTAATPRTPPTRAARLSRPSWPAARSTGASPSRTS